ncbi:unnamed protein product [Penicillium egyptiacum]|uniref:Enoyl reductase (ER) domain-containing protein n=1 Tax=Penicillium egyptiacum TaxID=1303716 RepID=A0A9W4P5N6_9EURO|nr:unnamed protein product [Penicillium egyptiacum]
MNSFPFKIGYDCAGVITEVGSEVTRFQVGAEVYTRLPERSRGSCSEFVICAEKYVALKPPSLSFEDAASIPLAAMTALQALRKYKGDLAGKTVFVPAGLIDYTKLDPRKVIESGSVDFLFDTVGLAMEYLCLMKGQSGCIVSVATMPSGNQLQKSSISDLPPNSGIPVALRMGLNAFDCVRKLRAWRYGVEYAYMFLESSGQDLDELRSHVEEHRLRTVVGKTVELSDIEAVRSACQTVYNGKGGLGKVVLKVANS